MRSRSNSGVRLDGYARLVQQTILCHQVCNNKPSLLFLRYNIGRSLNTVLSVSEIYLANAALQVLDINGEQNSKSSFVLIGVGISQVPGSLFFVLYLVPG